MLRITKNSKRVIAYGQRQKERERERERERESSKTKILKKQEKRQTQFCLD